MKVKPRILALRGALHRTAVALLVVLLAGCASTPEKLQIDPPDWTLEFDRPIQFQQLVNDRLLVVGTLRHLYGIDPANGERLWRKRNVAVDGEDLTPLGERPFLLVNDAAGGAFHDRDTNIIALDHDTGNLVWESPMFEGKILQGALDEDEEHFFFTTVQRPHGDDRGFLSGALGKGLGSGFKQVPQLHALEVASGRLLWSQPYARPVLMRPSHSRQLDDKSDWSDTRPFDLGLYHPPLKAGPMVCLTYEGMYCYKAATGELAWKRDFDVLENELALSYANPLVAGDSIITTGNHRIRAYDIHTGKRLWRSRKFDVISELILDEHVVYGQLGGQFFDIDKEKWKWKGDFGVVALDRNSGKTLWKYDNANDAITNLLVQQDKIWLADETHLIALSRTDGKVKFRRRHGFDDPPVFTALNEVGQVVLVGEGQAAAFNPERATLVWNVEHPTIGPGAWSRFGSALLRATGNILKFGSFVLSRGGGLLPSLAIPIGGVDFRIISTKKIVSGSMARSGRRLTYQSGASDMGVGNANVSGNFQYFVTQPRGYDKAVLAVVNLSTGQTERMIRMDADAPNLVINEGNNNLYEAYGKSLVALPLESRSSFNRNLTQQPSKRKER